MTEPERRAALCLWGARGSYPTPTREAAQTGGQTSCLEVRVGDVRLAFDLGSGFHQMADALGAANAGPPTVFLTHAHLDHVLALSRLGDWTRQGHVVHLVQGNPHGTTDWDAVRRLVLPPLLPDGVVHVDRVHWQQLPADGRSVTRDVRVRALPLNHPGGASGLLLEDAAGLIAAWAPDNELIDDEASLQALARQLRGIPVLFHDAHWDGDEAVAHRGWGHSSAQMATRLALASGAGMLVLVHHHPLRTDAQLERLRQACQAIANRAGSTLAVVIGREGLHVEVRGMRANVVATPPTATSGGAEVAVPVLPGTAPAGDAPVVDAAPAVAAAADAAAGDGLDVRRLEHLVEIARSLGQSLDDDVLLERIVTATFELVRAERCVIHMRGADGTLVPVLHRSVLGRAVPPSVPRSILQRAVDEGRAIITPDALGDQRFAKGQSVQIQQVRGMMCVPLRSADGAVLGTVYVDSLLFTHCFDEADLSLLHAFAGIAGAALDTSRLATQLRRQAVVQSNFERFFAPQLASRIAEHPDSVQLGGERRTVAVLFSDIRGFTAMSESMRPEEVASRLTRYFTEMVDCVFRHGGTLDKFIGDAIMAQWGAPESMGDDADRAMQAALDMGEALARLNAQWRAEGQSTMTIGIGLNYGEAFAGHIGSERRLEYTVIGDTVNTASRLCGAAGPGEIVFSDAFRQAITKVPPSAQQLPALTLKGRQATITAHRVAI